MDIKTIAKMADVSPATVSRVLNGKPVTDKTYRRVTAVVKETGYVPNAMGRNLRVQKTNKLLILVPTMQNSFYAEMVSAFERRARSLGYLTLLGVTNRNPELEKQYLDMLYTKQVDGLASFIPTISNNEINDLAARYPFVALCWHGSMDIDVNYVCIDNLRASYDMTKYLISLGHTKIAAMNGNYPERLYEPERKEGFFAAMQEACLPVPKEYYQICNYDFTDGYQACKILMELPNPPTAIFTMSDERAVGCLRYLQEHHLQAGRDVDIVGFDNISISRMTFPQITTVAQPCFEIGDEAASLLTRLITDRTQASRGIVLRHSLVIRDTTRTPPLA